MLRTLTPRWRLLKHNLPAYQSLDQSSICLITPNRQDALLQDLESFNITSTIVSLTDQDYLDTMNEWCNSTEHPVVCFVCATEEPGNTQEQYGKFLQLLQLLSSIEGVYFCAAAHRALPSPSAADVIHPLDAVYLGMTLTWSNEYPEKAIAAFNLSSISKASIETIINASFEESFRSIKHYDDEHCFWDQELIAHHDLKLVQRNGFKRHGVYLIIGGTGGLGQMMTQYLVESYDAKVICVSRRSINYHQSFFCHQNVLYQQLDLCNAAQVMQFFDENQNIDGIIHSALMLEDAPISTMTQLQLRSVISPKVNGTFNLFPVLAKRHFDFVVFFSSIQSFIANPGQANYTAACLSKDALAHTIRSVFDIKTVVINWGFWGEIGVVAKDFYRQRMQKLGIGSIHQNEGIDILEYCLMHDIKQLVCLKCTDQAANNMGLLLSKETNQMDISTLAMQALDDYACMRFHSIELTEQVVPRFKSLQLALAEIEIKESPSKEQLIIKFPELNGYLTLLEACLQQFNAILSGEIDPLTVLFPAGSFSLVEPVYRNNPVPDHYNIMVAETVKQLVQEQSGRLIRILEIGAGTGSTTEKVLPALKDQPVQYTFTDLSHAFIRMAKQQFAEYSFLDFKILNIEEQYQASDRYDIIIATNVLHATRNIDKTLNNITALMSDRATLVLNEITARQTFATLTFGLTEGWWLAEDDYRIPFSPLLSEESWLDRLSTNGLVVKQCRGSGGQHVMTAQWTEPSENVTTSSGADIKPFKQPMTSLDQEINIWLKTLISEVLLTPVDELLDNVPLRDFGIDSLIALELLSPIQKKVGYVPATLFFEYPTIQSLVEYLSTEFPASFAHAAPATLASSNLPSSVDHHYDPQATAKIIQSIIADALHHETSQISLELPFRDYGVDSLISIEIIARLKKQFGDLPATLLFEYPTILTLAEFIDHSGKSSFEPNSNLSPDNTALKPQLTQTPLINSDEDTLAIVGLAGIYPSANDEASLWQSLANGVDLTQNIPWQRWDSTLSDSSYTDKVALINNIQYFDNEFFKIPPIEAERIDPQERLFLQCTFHALEESGLRVSKLSGTEIGCFVGVMNHGYSWLTPRDSSLSSPSSLFWSIANRVSYQFNWHGPSLAIDTACSSSLSALHVASQAIRQGDCEMAIVGAVNLIVHPRQIDQLCELHMLSQSGTCKPFGHAADGFVDGEGVVSTVIMPLSKARKNRLKIHGLIRSSAVNSGGQSNGYTAPNVKAQTALIKKALDRAQLMPSDIHAVEAHGTGTELGDPVEISALTSAFASAKLQSIPIGSIKGNIGHLESAAGLASLVKVILQMKHKQLLPSIHAEVENSHLNLQQTPFYVNKHLTDWQQHTPYTVCLSSFGAGGANAHVVLQSYDDDYDEPDQQNNLDQVYCFPVSAHSLKALQNELLHLNWLISCNDNVSIRAISYGYCCVREVRQYRVGFIANSLEELRDLARKNLQHWFSKRKAPIDSSISILMESFLQSHQTNPHLAQQLIDLFCAGHDVDFSLCFETPERSILPRYAFDALPHWIDAEETNFNQRQGIIRQHVMFDNAMAPAALAFSLLREQQPFTCVSHIIWKKIITDIDDISLAVAEGAFVFRHKESSEVVCQGDFTASTQNDIAKLPSIYANHPHSPSLQELNHSDIYDRFASYGYQYGEAFRVIQQAQVSQYQVEAVICVNDDWGFDLSPVVIDASLQCAILFQEQNNHNQDTLFVPFMIEQFTVNRLPQLTEPMYCRCVRRATSDPIRAIYDIDISDAQGEPYLLMRGVVSIKTALSELAKDQITTVDEYEIN